MAEQRLQRLIIRETVLASLQPFSECLIGGLAIGGAMEPCEVTKALPLFDLRLQVDVPFVGR